MFLRLVSSVVLVACTGSVAFATERGTFILTDGERKSGTIVYHGDQHENLINGYLNLGVDNGKDMTFPIGQVAVIDFVGGQPQTSELAQLAAGHMLVLRSGATQQGRLINLTGGDTLFWENETKQRQQYAITDVSRVYLNPQSARTIFGYTAPVATDRGQTSTGRNQRDRGVQGGWGSPGNQGNQRGGDRNATGGNQGDWRDQNWRDDQNARGDRTGRDRTITVRINADQGWTDSGLIVDRGERLIFETSRPVRGLMGRIGNGAAFTIGLDAIPNTMRTSGQLMLRVSDDARRGDQGPLAIFVSRP